MAIMRSDALEHRVDELRGGQLDGMDDKLARREVELEIAARAAPEPGRARGRDIVDCLVRLEEADDRSEHDLEAL